MKPNQRVKNHTIDTNFHTMNQVHNHLSKINTYARDINLNKQNVIPEFKGREPNHNAHKLIMKYSLY